MKKITKTLKISCYTMLILPTLASIVCAPSMWEVSEIILLYSGLIAVFAYAIIKNEIVATMGCTIIWASIFFLPIKLDRTPKMKIMFFVFQGIFSTLNAIVGMMVIGGKYV